MKPAAEPTAAAAAAKPRPRRPGGGARRLFWMRQFRRWHWISSAVCLAGLLLFAATGLTLNHAAQIPARERVVERRAQLPAGLAHALADPALAGRAPLPAPVAAAASQALRFGALAGRPAEWDEDEAVVALPRPGGEADVRIDRRTGVVVYTRTTRGWVALLNDLHKGRNAGPAWGGFIDVFAVACLVFAATGLGLLALHARQRPVTWPLVLAGLGAPLVLVVVLLLHA